MRQWSSIRRTTCGVCSCYKDKKYQHDGESGGASYEG